jgi:hypothetical protein
VFNKSSITCLAAAACLLLSASNAALAVEVGGVKLDDSIRIDNHDLVLNGAGLRTKVIFKVYALGLYLEQKQSTVPAILAASGTRRISIVMLRDVSSDDFGASFMTGLSHNTSKDEQIKLMEPTRKFGEMFALIPGLKKGDALTVDWVPGTGIICLLNGKKIGPTVTDIAFYNAILKIWIGDEPADNALKPRLLGQTG